MLFSFAMNAKNVCCLVFLLTEPHCFPVVIASEVNETHGVSSECLGNNGTPAQMEGSLSNSPKQLGVYVCSPNEQRLSKASNVTFISTPPMHINDQVELVDLQNMQMHVGGIDSKSFPEPTGYNGSSGNNKKKDSVPCIQSGLCAQRNYFSPYWSLEAVEKALEVSSIVIVISHKCIFIDNMKLLLLFFNIITFG